MIYNYNLYYHNLYLKTEEVHQDQEHSSHRNWPNQRFTVGKSTFMHNIVYSWEVYFTKMHELFDLFLTVNNFTLFFNSLQNSCLFL